MSKKSFTLRKWFLVVVCSATLLSVARANADDPENAYDTSPIRVGAGSAEEAIREKLLETTSVDFTDTPLEDVLVYIERLHELEIELDLRALDDLGIDSGSPINRQLSGITLRSALDLILSDLDLTYIIDSEVLLVTSIEEAETRLNVVVYPVKDLLPAPKDGAVSHDALMEVIVTSVDPVTWDEIGGPGSVVGFLDSIIISQTDEVHEHIFDLLQGLRELSPFEGRGNVTVRGGGVSEGGGGAGSDGESN